MFQTKVGNPSCQNTEVRGKQSMLSVKENNASKTYLIKTFGKKLAPSPWQLFTEKKFEARFESWMVSRGTEVCEQL